MYFVYILKAEGADHWYVGMTNDLERRLGEHNAGKSAHTGKIASKWHVQSYTAFQDYYRAAEFEKYLKSHSGRAFAKKRL